MCFQCYQQKARFEFYYDRATKDGFSNRCVLCTLGSTRIETAVYQSGVAYNQARPQRMSKRRQQCRRILPVSRRRSTQIVDRVKACFKCMQLKPWSQFPVFLIGAHPVGDCVLCQNAGESSTTTCFAKPVITVLDYSKIETVQVGANS